jgi:amino acid adenylation domain-containing protein
VTPAAALLARLRALDVKVTVDGDGLRCSAPKGVLTAALQEELARLKPEIIDLVKSGESVAGSRPARMARTGDVPLSFVQQRLWFLDQLEPGTSTYTIAVRRRLRGPIDRTALARALTELVRRHESLRTTFVTRNGEPRQQIMSPEPVAPEIIDLERVPAADREAVVEEHVHKEVQRPFSLARGPLFRPVLLRLAPDEHELIVSIHHIVSDGWSLGLIAREIEVLYQAYTTGGASPLPDVPLQYADFAIWQRQWLAGDILEAQRAYWRAQLAALPPPLELPTDHPRARQSSPAAASHDLTLPRRLADALRQLSRREGVTPFMTMLAGFKAVLARCTGTTDIVLGTPVANRNHLELESIVGFFANTLVLRTNLDGDPTFRELLRRVREVSLSAYAHQDMPFEKLVEDLKPDRKLGQNPLFQISFVFQSAAGAGGRSFDFVTVGSPFDLTLFARETAEGGLSATIEYRRDLFRPDTIARIAGHYRTLLEGAAADPDRRLSALPLVDPDELHRILVEWNATTTDYPRERSIHGLFEDQAAATPDAVAVVFEGATLTYRELDRRANRLAHYLRSLGVRPERPVGLWMERSPEVVVAILGILKAGGAYAPFDLMAPPERIAFMLRDARIDVLLTQQRMLARLPAEGVRSICLDADQRDIAAQPDTRLPDEATGDSLAYIMYTSGSTGEPKGVAVTHRGVVRLVRGTGYAHFGPDEVILQLAPLSFDASTFEIWGALLNGGRLAVSPPGMLSVDELGALLARHGVTTLWLTAGFFHQVVDQRVEVLRPLRQLLAGGDVLSVPHVRQVLAALPGVRLVNGYGPTEGTTFTCCHRIAGEAGLERSVPIGRPIANTRVYVLDRDRQPVPIGVPGELWIAGDGLARGYVERPDLTAERFVTQRLSDRIEERLYRSGDVVRWLADGTLEFLGRQDTQVKLRGFRVELGEVESTLARHPRVRDVAVVVRPGAGGDKRLVAYLVPDGALAARDLRDLLRAKLPEYMVPSAFVLLEQLPLTPNGKVDRTRLPAPEESRERVETVVLPCNDEERQLVAIWEEVLAVSGIGTRDNFFDLGGHSLLALRMFVRLEQSLRIRLPIATLFEAPTIEELAAVIRQGGRMGQWRSLVAIQPAGRRAPIFAVPGVGGNVLCYNDLARFMVPDQPLYGLQSRGLDGSEQPLTRIEDIAAAFVQEIREVQPEGPYFLAGMCMGGVVAYEMAQQIRAAGQEIGLLILLETWPPVGTWGRLLRPGARLLTVLRLVQSRLRLYAQTWARLDGRQRMKYLLGRVRMLGEMVAQRDVFRGDRSEFYQDVVNQANLIAYQEYEPRPYTGRVVFFLAEGRRVIAHQDRRLAWRQLITGDLEIQTVPGDDSGLMLAEPHVQVLARELKARIERELSRPASSPPRSR